MRTATGERVAISVATNTGSWRRASFTESPCEAREKPRAARTVKERVEEWMELFLEGAETIKGDFYCLAASVT